MVKRYRKKPVVIEAIEFTGHNDAEVLAFIGPDGFDPDEHRPTIAIHTLEGVMTADVGDFIIRGVKGEHYPCKPDVFWRTYEEA